VIHGKVNPKEIHNPTCDGEREEKDMPYFLRTCRTTSTPSILSMHPFLTTAALSALISFSNSTNANPWKSIQTTMREDIFHKK
jgi:hypothetical protein